jgi:hypothetical protein
LIRRTQQYRNNKDSKVNWRLMADAARIKLAKSLSDLNVLSGSKQDMSDPFIALILQYTCWPIRVFR